MVDHDILIVGAGPSGLMLALECQRFGVDFGLIEKRPGPSEHSKALGIWSGTLEALSPLALTGTFLDRGVQINAARFADRGNTLARFDASEGVDSLYPHPIILPQNETEAILIEKLESSGGRVERELECIDLAQENDQVRATLKTATGETITRTCRYLVGCDGSRSPVRNLCGIEFPGSTEPATYLLYDGTIDGHDLPNELMSCWSGEGALVVIPIKNGQYRLICQRERGEDLSAPTREELQEQVDHNGPANWQLGEPDWASAFRISERIADDFRDRRVFLCGDAAHIHSPAGGQGMNTGMQDASNLAWKLAAALGQPGDPEKWLNSYQEERRPVAESVVKGAQEKLQFGMAQGLLARVIKDLAVSTVFQSAAFRKHLAFDLSELGIEYEESAMIEPDAWGYSTGGYKPGVRVRSAPVQDANGDTTELWERLLHPGFTLLFFGAKPNPESHDLWNQIRAKVDAANAEDLQFWSVWQSKTLPDGVDSSNALLDPEGKAHHRFGIHGPGWYLIRPDLYVGSRSSPVCFETLQSVLDLYFT